jgi:tetratricopeptide (TPR) repeat protein
MRLGSLYQAQGQYSLAEPLYQRTLSIWEQALGPDHPWVAYPLNGLATLSREQGQYSLAERLYQRALAIGQQQSGHPETATTLHDLAHFYELRNQSDQALALYQQALAIREQQLGSEHPRTVETRTRYAHLRGACGWSEEASALEATSTEQATTRDQESAHHSC